MMASGYKPRDTPTSPIYQNLPPRNNPPRYSDQQPRYDAAPKPRYNDQPPTRNADDQQCYVGPAKTAQRYDDGPRYSHDHHQASGASGARPRDVTGQQQQPKGPYGGAGAAYASSEDDEVIRERVVGVRTQWQRRSSGSEDGGPVLVRKSSWRVEEDAVEGRTPQRGAVNRVSREWRVHEDGALAHKMQEEENRHHHGHNRAERSLVRKDIIDAKIVQHEEELRLQEVKMREIEEKKRIAERDAAFAQRLLSEEEDEEDRLRRIAAEDEQLARQLMRDASIEEETQLQMQQDHDERVAIELQKREERRFERYKEKKRERELERTRKRLEMEIDKQRQQVIPSTGEAETSTTEHRRRLSSDGVSEDTDFTDFYKVDPELDEAGKRDEVERQDAELARLLQDQEHKRGGKPTRDLLKSIEERDEELAKVIQEQEKLKAEKREKRMREMRLIKSQQHVVQATSSLSVNTDADDVMLRLARPPAPQYPSPPNYEAAVSRSRENLSQSPGRNESRDSRSPSPPAYRSPPTTRSRDVRPQSAYTAPRSLANGERSRDPTGKSPPPYEQSNRLGQSATRTDNTGRLNRSFDNDVITGRPISDLPRDEFGTARAPTHRSSDQSAPSYHRNSSYPLPGISAQYANYKPSQSAHAISSTTSREPKTDQSALRTSQTMHNIQSGERKPVGQSRSVPAREELRRAVDPHDESDDSDEAGFLGQGQGQTQVRGHPNSRSRPQANTGSFNIVAALDPTYRPSANQQTPYVPTNQPPGQDCHEYLRNQYSTLEYGDSPLYGSDDDDENDWMPVQGQRRPTSGKSSKKRPVSAAAGDKDKCKQQ